MVCQIYYCIYFHIWLKKKLIKIIQTFYCIKWQNYKQWIKKIIRDGNMSLGCSTDSDFQLSSWRNMAKIYQSDLISTWLLDT